MSASGSDLQTKVGVTTLKKAQDQMKEQGAALIEMIEQSGVSPDGRSIDTYA